MGGEGEGRGPPSFVSAVADLSWVAVVVGSDASLQKARARFLADLSWVAVLVVFDVSFVKGNFR